MVKKDEILSKTKKAPKIGGEVAKAILAIAGGVLLVTAVAGSGNLIQVVDRFLKKKESKTTKRQQYYYSEVLNKLKKSGYIVQKGEYLTLSEKGQARLEELEMAEYAIPVPRSWDRKYRVIIFDVPIDKNALRNAVRSQLTLWGFKRIQQSVWVHPYECREVVALLKTRFGLTEDVLYMVVDEIENDRWLKDEFSLS